MVDCYREIGGASRKWVMPDKMEGSTRGGHAYTVWEV